MRICIFLGHNEVYDVNIDQKIRSAIRKVMTGGHEVEFLFYTEGKFYTRCLSAALEAKHMHPQRVKLTLLLPEGVSADCVKVGFLFDNIVSSGSQEYAEKAQYAITYFYPELDRHKAEPRVHIKAPEQTATIDVTSSDTAAYLRYADKSAVKECARKRYRERQSQKKSEPVVCTLMLSGPIINWEIFRNAIDFLINEFGVSEFLVGRPLCYNQHAVELSKIIRSRDDVRMTAYVNRPEFPEMSIGSAGKKLFLYSQVIHVPPSKKTFQGQVSQINTEMLRRSEYVICNSRKSPETFETVQKKIDQFRHVKVLDIKVCKT